MKFAIEFSNVPIYNRIASAFTRTLIDFGHEVHFIDATDFNENDFIRIINSLDVDYYISTNELNFIQRHSNLGDYFLFEKISNKILFIHHDNLFSAFDSIKYISKKINALVSSKEKIIHFCLESSNVDLLKNIGIDQAYRIEHASEFKKSAETIHENWSIGFIGHLMSSLSLYPSNSLPAGQYLKKIAWNRLRHSSFNIKSHIEKLTNDEFFLNTLGTEFNNDLIATEQFLIAGLNKFSSPMRGELISTIKNLRVDIFGGDLSYGRMSNPLLILRQSNIYYNPPTIDYQDAQKIYQSTRINLNISSLQFDTAVNNRVIDILLSGGFVLTDRRSDLKNIIPFYQDISYETPEEMNEKLSFWSSTENNKKYFELKYEAYDICKNKYSYHNRVNSILNILKFTK
jgi:hypothetical protein